MTMECFNAKHVRCPFTTSACRRPRMFILDPCARCAIKHYFFVKVSEIMILMKHVDFHIFVLHHHFDGGIQTINKLHSTCVLH